GISAATGPLVANVKERVEHDRKAADAVREIGRITLDGMEALRRNDLAAAGRLMDRNHALLTGLGVGHPMLDRLVQAARKTSYGAKLTGAGGGGGRWRRTSGSSRMEPSTPKGNASWTSGRPRTSSAGILRPARRSTRPDRRPCRVSSTRTPMRRSLLPASMRSCGRPTAWGIELWRRG